MPHSESVVFVCPFWGRKGHVGTFRAERLVKWLHQHGFKVVVVRAGTTNQAEASEFGRIISVRDPLNVSPDSVSSPGSVRKPNPLRRFLAYLLLVPDPFVVWGQKVATSPEVHQACLNASHILASSPPESTFLAASKLASAHNLRFIMDMRDGWLDEPMKPLLRKYRFQQFREQRLEAKMLHKATHVSVTSAEWKSMLLARYPEMSSEKVHVIPNTYPEGDFVRPQSIDSTNKSFIISHAGRLFSSRPEREIHSLMRPFLQELASRKLTGEFRFIGDLIPEEESELDFWRDEFAVIGWKLTRLPQQNRESTLKLLAESDGLLLLSPSRGSIPAKFFDYAAVRRPVLALTCRGSALENASKGNPLFFRFYPGEDGPTRNTIAGFADSLRNYPDLVTLSSDFEESTVKRHFMEMFR